MSSSVRSCSYGQEEQEKARRTCALGAEVLAIAGKMAKPGVTTDEIDRYAQISSSNLTFFVIRFPVSCFSFPVLFTKLALSAIATRPH